MDKHKGILSPEDDWDKCPTPCSGKNIGEYPKMDIDLQKYLKRLRKVDFRSEYVVSQGGGWKGFRNLANEILKRLNKVNADNLAFFVGREKT